MQIRKNKNHTALYILTGFIVLGIATGGYWLIHTRDHSSVSTTVTKMNTDKPTSEQIKAGQEAKSATLKGTSQDTGNLETGETPPPSSSTATPQISITAANQNGSVIQVRALIPKVTTSGTCTLILKNGSYTVTHTAPVQALADSATCEGFDVPTSELAAKGTWVAAITYTDSNGSTQATQNIIIK